MSRLLERLAAGRPTEMPERRSKQPDGTIVCFSGGVAQVNSKVSVANLFAQGYLPSIRAESSTRTQK